jgi:hypothetical protein
VTYEDGTVRSETSAHKIQAPGNHPKERIQHSEHGESLKSYFLLGHQNFVMILTAIWCLYKVTVVKAATTALVILSTE